MAMSMAKVAKFFVESTLLGEVTFMPTVVADVVGFVATATTTSRILALLVEFLCPHDFDSRVNRFEKRC